jgi:hypothetical protein
MEVSLDNFTVCNPPVQKNIKGESYTIIAYRYDGYGIDVMVHIKEGRLMVTMWQDNHKTAKPIHFNLKAHALKPSFDFDAFRRKHDENDLSIFEDFRVFLLNTENACNLLQSIWDAFPNATWTRACGFLIEDLVNEKKYELVRMFWKHDMFRMGGKDRAEALKTLFQED